MDEEGESFFARHWLQLLLGVLALAAIIVALYFTLYKPVACDTYECFQNKMAACEKAAYINEEPEASWRYEILKESNGACNIKVTMLQAKKGELELDRLNGYSMECKYPKGIVTYPDKDLGVCSGQLKEELQSIVIKKLYGYILDNLGELNQSLRSAI
jgi:hypothetical protein